MEIFDKIRQVLRFLVECLSPWIAMGGRDGLVQRDETPNHDSCIWMYMYLTAVYDVIVYVKGHEKRMWLWNLLLDDKWERIYIETLDAVYEEWNL